MDANPRPVSQPAQCDQQPPSYLPPHSQLDPNNSQPGTALEQPIPSVFPSPTASALMSHVQPLQPQPRPTTDAGIQEMVGYGYGGPASHPPPPPRGRVAARPSANTRRAPLATPRGSGFPQIEVDTLLNNIEKYLPLCREEWDAVLIAHNTAFAGKQRTVESLRRKFATLHRRSMPTGDPLMPDDVRRAKRLKHTMTERADITSADDAESAAQEYIPAVDGASEVVNNAIVPINEPRSTGATVLPRNDFSDEEIVANERGSSTAIPSPRPIVNKRSQTRRNSDYSGDIGDLIKMTLLRDDKQREEERRRRDEERRDDRLRREEDRRIERERQEREDKRHEKFMEMILLVLAGPRNQSNAVHTTMNGRESDS